MVPPTQTEAEPLPLSPEPLLLLLSKQGEDMKPSPHSSALPEYFLHEEAEDNHPF